MEIAFGNIGIKLKVDMRVGIGGDRWPAANLFCNFISQPRWQSFFKDLFKDKAIIELGAGTGFVGLLVSILCQPSEMIITDQASHIGLIQENIALNDNLVCKSIIFDWLNFDSFNVKKYDIVLGLECVYAVELFDSFIRALVACCHQQSIVFLGMTREYSKPTFFEKLGLYFTYTLIPDVNIKDDNDQSNIGLFICQLLPDSWQL